MSRTEDIVNTIWSDLEDLSGYAALLYIWSWTNERCGMAGLYRVTRRQMLESRVPEDAIDGALGELGEQRFAFYEDGYLFVRARVKRLRTKAPSIAKAIAKDLRAVPEGHPMGAMFVAENGHLTWLKPYLQEVITGTPSTTPRGAIEHPTTFGSVEPFSDTPSTPPRGGPGAGVGERSTRSDDGEPQTVDARALVDDERLTTTVAILRQCNRLFIDPELLGVANTLVSYPNGDHEQAARLAATKAADPNYRTTNAGVALRYAFQELERSNGALRDRPSLRRNGARSLAQPGDAGLFARTERELAERRARGLIPDDEGAF